MFQCALLLLTSVFIVIKQMVFPNDLLVNIVGNSANLAFCGFGAFLLGVFNIIFFPMYYKNPTKVGIPFVASSSAQFMIIAIMIAIRQLPFYAPLTLPDFEFYSLKLTILLCGLTLYFVMTVFAARISGKKFEQIDL